MSQNCTHDCSNCSESCAERAPESLLEKPHAASSVKKVIGVVSGKGGVGKSMVTSLLAVMTQRDGLHAGIMDADITGPSIPQAFGLHQKAMGTEQGLFPVRTKTGIDVMSINLLLEHETDPVVWRGPVIAGMIKQFWTDVIWKDIDILYIDMPPGTGDVPLTAFQSIPLSGVVIVTTPQELVGMVVEKAYNMAKLMDVPVLGLVENMSYVACPDCGKQIRVFGESRLHALAERLNIPVAAELPLDGKLSAAADAGMLELFDGAWLNELYAAIERL